MRLEEEAPEEEEDEEEEEKSTRRRERTRPMTAVADSAARHVMALLRARARTKRVVHVQSCSGSGRVRAALETLARNRQTVCYCLLYLACLARTTF